MMALLGDDMVGGSMRPIRFNESYYVVPPAALDADPAGDMRAMLFRLSRAESGLEECELQRRNDQQERLIELIELSDRVMAGIDSADASSDTRETAVVNGLVGFGRTLRELLDRHQVEALTTIGMPMDESVAVAVKFESGGQVPVGTVLREQRIGYRWPHGLLRKAEVLVCGSATRGQGTPAASGPAPVA